MIVLLLTLLLGGITIYQFRFATIRRRPVIRAWQQVLSKLEKVNVDGLQLIAGCYLQPDQNQLQMEPPDMWEIVGGLDGIAQLNTNATLMLELARVAEQWNREEGLIIAEMLRRDAARIRKSTMRLRFILLWSSDSARAPFHLQEAVSSYCLMRSRLFGLYHNAHIALLPQLSAAL